MVNTMIHSALTTISMSDIKTV